MIRGKIKKMMAAALAATMVFTMTACGSDSEEKTADGYAKEIYLYNWSEYMSEDVLNKFEEEYGIKVVLAASCRYACKQSVVSFSIFFVLLLRFV